MIEPEIEYTAFVQEDTEDGMEKVMGSVRLALILSHPVSIDTELMEKYLKYIANPKKITVDNIVRFDDPNLGLEMNDGFAHRIYGIGSPNCPCPQCREDREHEGTI